MCFTFLRYASATVIYFTIPSTTLNFIGLAVESNLPSSRNVLPLNLNTIFPPFTSFPFSSIILAVNVIFSPI